MASPSPATPSSVVAPSESVDRFENHDELRRFPRKRRDED